MRGAALPFVVVLKPKRKTKVYTESSQEMRSNRAQHLAFPFAPRFFSIGAVSVAFSHTFGAWQSPHGTPSPVVAVSIVLHRAILFSFLAHMVEDGENILLHFLRFSYISSYGQAIVMLNSAIRFYKFRMYDSTSGLLVYHCLR